MRWNKSFEGTLHIEDADLQKMAKVLNDVNIKECPYFDLSDKYGNSARYYRDNQWIPCSERSPQKSGNYIVTERRYSMDDRKHEGKYQTIVEEVRFTGEKWDKAKFFDIIAWMPLPEPYKEEEE